MHNKHGFSIWRTNYLMCEIKCITHVTFFLTLDNITIKDMSGSLFSSPFKYILCQFCFQPFAYAILLLWNDLLLLRSNNWPSFKVVLRFPSLLWSLPFVLLWSPVILCFILRFLALCILPPQIDFNFFN